MMGNTNVINAIADLHKTLTSKIQTSLAWFHMFQVEENKDHVLKSSNWVFHT
jgi:hypothetical protein